MKETEIQDGLKYLIIGGIALLLATPLIVSNSLFFPYITGKAYFFRIVVEVIFFLWLILATVAPQYRPKRSWLSCALVGFMAVILIADINGVNWTASFWSNFERMEGYITLIHLFALFLITSSIMKTRGNWIFLFNAFFLTSLISVSQAIVEVSQSGINTRVDTTLGNSTYLAVYMLFAAFTSLWLIAQFDFSKISKWWESWRVWVCVIYGLGFLSQSFVIFQTGTRGAMLGLLGGLVLVATINIFFGKNKKVKFVAISGFMALAILVGLLFSFKDSSFVQKFSGLKRITTISASEGTGQARLINWGIAREAVAERPILGWGQSNYNIGFDKYYDPIMHGNEVWFDRTHNIILDWLIAGGYVGLLLYLSILVAAAYLIWFKSKGQSITSKSILIGLLAAYFVHNLFVFDNIVSYIFFFFILSYIHSQNGNDLVVAGVNYSEKELTPKMKSVLIILFIFAMPVSVFGFNYHSYSANRELIAAMQITEEVKQSDGTTALRYKYDTGLEENLDLFLQALSRGTFGNPEIRQRMLLMVTPILRIKDDNAAEIKQVYVQTTIDQLNIQMEESPLDSRFPYLLGTLFGNLGKYDLAEQNLLRVIELSPKKQAVRIPLIRFYLISGKTEEAVNLAKETYELDTTKDDLWVEYAITLSAFDKESFNTLINESIDSGMYKRVEMLLNKNIDQSPENPQTYISLSAFYNQIGNATKSLEIIDQTIEKFPDNKSQLLEIRKQVTN